MLDYIAKVDHADIVHAGNLQEEQLLLADSMVRAPHPDAITTQACGTLADFGSGCSDIRLACERFTVHTRLTLLVCLILLSGASIHSLDAQQLQVLVDGVHHLRLGSIALFIVLFAVAVVLLLPGMLLSFAAGAAYGFYIGLAISWLGTVLGQVGAFLLGRFLLRDIVFSFLVKRVQGFASIDKKLSGHDQEGHYKWTPYTFVLLLRMSPVLPYNIMNYVLGVTSIDLLPYTLSSAVAAVPYLMFFVFLGSTATDMHALLRHSSGGLSPEWLIAMACISILSVIGLLLIIRNVCQGGDEENSSLGRHSVVSNAAGPGIAC